MREKFIYTLFILLAFGVGAYFIISAIQKPNDKNKPVEVPVVETAPRPPKTPHIRELIIVDYPEQGDVVTSPLTIEGRARGTWYFEGDFPVKLLDVRGNLVAMGIATAQGEWMTEDYVPFTVTIDFVSPETKEGNLIFERNNPSDLEENAMKFELPVKFSN